MTYPYQSSNLKTITIPEGNEQRGWDSIKNEIRILTDWGVGRLRKGLDGYARTVLLEPQYVCKDYRNLYSNFYSKKFIERSSYCSRLHFFNAPDLRVSDLINEPVRYKDTYIGYSVIQPVIERCLGRTVIDPFMIGKTQNSFFCLRTRTTVNINGCEFSVEGYPYYSQSGEAMVCAHASLWGVCRHLSERYSCYGEVYPYDLIEATGKALGRRVPYRGMTYSDYSEILSSIGCYPVIIKPRTLPKTPSWLGDREAFYSIYSYVESGFPVLTSFSGHVATIIGHTINTSINPAATVDKIDDLKETPFYNSFSLLKQFIVVDDNFFPYELLGYNNDTSNYGQYFKTSETTLPNIPSIDSIFAAVVPLPEKAFLPVDKAKSLAYKYFLHKDANNIINIILNRLGKKDDKLIARLFLTSSIKYKKRKKEYSKGVCKAKVDPLSNLPVDFTLPHFLWVMEISPLSLYNDGLCIGEVVLDASVSEEECNYIYMRIGNTVFRDDKMDTYEPGLLAFPQYTHNLGENNG